MIMNERGGGPKTWLQLVNRIYFVLLKIEVGGIENNGKLIKLIYNKNFKSLYLVSV